MIISLILMTSLIDKAMILQGEIWFSSLLGLNRQFIITDHGVNSHDLSD